MARQRPRSKTCSTTACSGGVVSILRSSDRGTTWERPMRGGGMEEEEKRGELLQTMGRLNSIGCVFLLPWGLLYIGGGGRHQPLLQGRGGGWAKGQGCALGFPLGAMRPPLASLPCAWASWPVWGGAAASYMGCSLRNGPIKVGCPHKSIK